MRRSLIIIDLEATCWEKGDPFYKLQKDLSEIIEIGAVRVAQTSCDWVIEDEFQTFVRPLQNPKLTKFCTDLTKITQDQINSAPDLTDAWKNFLRWAPKNSVGVSWGIGDLYKIEQQCSDRGLTNPWHKENWLDLKEVFSRQMRRLGKTPKGRGLSKALSEAGLLFSGSPHRAIDDAKMTARLGAWLCHPDRFSNSLKRLFELSQEVGRPLTFLEALEHLGERKEAIPPLKAEAIDLGVPLFIDL